MRGDARQGKNAGAWIKTSREGQRARSACFTEEGCSPIPDADEADERTA